MPHAHKTHSIEHLHQSKHWYLKQIKVFADLPEAYKRELLDMSQMVLYRKHATISFPGKPGDTIFLLKEGRVKISRLNEKGHEVTICLLEPGEIFGEMKTIDSIPRETLVQALEPVVICEIARENFLRFLDRCPTEVIRLLKTVGGHLRNIEAKFGDLVLHNAAARLAKLLLQLCETIGENDKGTIRLNVQLTHQNLVNLIGTSRETVSALLSQFQRQGLMIQDHRHIGLLDTNGLTNIS